MLQALSPSSPLALAEQELTLSCYDSKGAPAAEEDSLASIGNHVEEDLQRFQKFMEERQGVDRLGRIPR
jgi:hypothetical protein